MIDRTPEWIARAAGGDLWVSERRGASARRSGPRQVTFDARKTGPGKTGPGDLFCALLGGRTELRRQSAVALRRGAWGLLTSKHAAADLRPAQWPVIVVDDALLGLQSLARAWRQELGGRVVAITGSCGKTSTKDILAPMLSRRWRVRATPGSYNNDIGVPVSMLQAEPGTDILVLEIAMWSPDSVGELARIARPDVGIVLNIGPAHLAAVGGLEEVARAKAELIAELPAGAGCIVPASEPLLARHLRHDLRTFTFGSGGDVSLCQISDQVVEIDAAGERVQLELSYDQPYNVENTLAAVAAALSLGYVPEGRVEPDFAPLRGETVRLTHGVTLINDCYNANPLSVRAALDDLARRPASRRIAVLGIMAELGEHSDRYHLEIGAYARAVGVDWLIAVGEDADLLLQGFAGNGCAAQTYKGAAELVRCNTRAGDLVLIKASRVAGLERIAEVLTSSRFRRAIRDGRRTIEPFAWRAEAIVAERSVGDRSARGRRRAARDD